MDPLWRWVRGIADPRRDYQLALKHFLRATEMETPPSGSSVEGTPKSRSWWGVKLVRVAPSSPASPSLCIPSVHASPSSAPLPSRPLIPIPSDTPADTPQSLRRLLESKIAPETSVPPEMATTPDQLRALDELATQRLLAVGGAEMEARRKVLAGGERVR
jgi:hypothetical protein